MSRDRSDAVGRIVVALSLAVAGLMVLCESLAGCGAAAASPTAAVDIGQIAACIIGQLQNSADVEQIATACGPATAADVLEIVTELLATETVDAGPSAVMTHAHTIKKAGK